MASSTVIFEEPIAPAVVGPVKEPASKKRNTRFVDNLLAFLREKGLLTEDVSTNITLFSKDPAAFKRKLKKGGRRKNNAEAGGAVEGGVQKARAPKKPSAYNIWIGQKITELKAANFEGHLMKEAMRLWREKKATTDPAAAAVPSPVGTPDNAPAHPGLPVVKPDVFTHFIDYALKEGVTVGDDAMTLINTFREEISQSDSKYCDATEYRLLKDFSDKLALIEMDEVQQIEILYILDDFTENAIGPSADDDVTMQE